MIRAISGVLTTAVQGHVESWGKVGRETGAFLLRRRESDTVDMIAWPLVVGIVRSRGQFAVSGIALVRLFEWCGDEDIQIAALLHSHKFDAFLSPVDLKHGFAAEGFLSTIVPDYATPPREPRQWKWWSFTGGRWIDAQAPDVAEAVSFSGVSFDESKVSSLKIRPEGLTPAEASELCPRYLESAEG